MEIIKKSTLFSMRAHLILENRFNITLKDNGTPIHQPITRFYRQEAKQLIKYGTTIVENIGSIKNIPPKRIPTKNTLEKI